MRFRDYPHSTLLPPTLGSAFRPWLATHPQTGFQKQALPGLVPREIVTEFFKFPPSDGRSGVCVLRSLSLAQGGHCGRPHRDSGLSASLALGYFSDISNAKAYASLKAPWVQSRDSYLGTLEVPQGRKVGKHLFSLLLGWDDSEAISQSGTREVTPCS